MNDQPVQTYEEAIARLRALHDYATECSKRFNGQLDAAGVVIVLGPVLEAIELEDVEIDTTESSE